MAKKPCRRCIYENACGHESVDACEGRTTSKDVEICVICGEKIEGWGNAPWPIKEYGSCCDLCNMTYVIPARIAKLNARAKADQRR